MSANRFFGLVLAGGKSKRMGEDKGSLVYHGQPQREYAYELLKPYCDETFISLRQEQEPELDSIYKRIIDNDKYKGPFNGIMSAHQAYPEVAWLVVATDLPLLQASDIKKLIQHRNPLKLATAFATKQSGLPEPLIAIWEPRGLKVAQTFLDSDLGSCPRKFLINNEIELVYPKSDTSLMNANTLEDYNNAQKHLK